MNLLLQEKVIRVVNILSDTNQVEVIDTNGIYSKIQAWKDCETTQKHYVRLRLSEQPQLVNSKIVPTVMTYSGSWDNKLAFYIVNQNTEFSFIRLDFANKYIPLTESYYLPRSVKLCNKIQTIIYVASLYCKLDTQEKTSAFFLPHVFACVETLPFGVDIMFGKDWEDSWGSINNGSLIPSKLASVYIVKDFENIMAARKNEIINS